MPRVSVIIPAFNAERHVEEALRSIEAQTYRDWEIVLCDDCSTDRTAEIARGFGPRVEVVQSRKTSGPAVARNHAVEQSSGELLAFLDADDYWLGDYLERQVALYDESEAGLRRVGVVACDARILAPEGFLPSTYLDVVNCPDEVDLERLLISNPIFVSALAPRAVVEEVGGFAPDLFGTEDHDLWIRIVELGYEVVIARRALAVYRLGEASVSTDRAAMARNERHVYTRALARGKLSPRERRVARRELRRRRAMERVVTADGAFSYRRAFRSLPLVFIVFAEHPHSWRSVARMLARRRSASSSLPVGQDAQRP